MTFKLWFKEVFLIDVKLVIKSINIIGLNGFSQISEWLKIRDFSKSEHIIIEKFNSTGGPTDKLVYNYSDSSCINSCEVDCNDAIVFQILATIAFIVLTNIESVFDPNPFVTIFCVFKIKRFYLSFFNKLKLKGIKSNWIFSFP